ncbi:MAG: hypothetical protein A2297_00445 [Elusimicrobia bacterium RIFOXYB2_FULL_48_7]|nr:MAG: hypothetical protein A2297_00445 [Elusimicrobia bacterium RIFOXYB2_FULL_48_7]
MARVRKVTVKYFSSFEEADKASLEESLAMTPGQRINALNMIRRRIFALKGIKADNSVKKVISYGKR